MRFFSSPTPTKTDPEAWKAYRPKKLSIDEIRDGCVYLTNGDNNAARVCVINEEFRQGLDFRKTYGASVSFFGSARLSETDEHYEQARRLAARVVNELEYAVVTGGGPGIMEAANRGAFEAGGKSIGYTIQLPREQVTNPYLTDQLAFHYFFSRKVVLSYAAESYLFFAGGFGTLDEFFELITLKQTQKFTGVPIILVGVDFWQPLDAYIQKTLLEEHGTISPEDPKLYTITDDENEIMEIIKNAPRREMD